MRQRRSNPYCHVLAPSLSISDVNELVQTYSPMVALYVWHDGHCALCGGEVPLAFTVADHCHETDWVRGLLCMSCNALEAHGPGAVRDPDQAAALARYVDHPPARILGLRIPYRDCRQDWRRSCASYDKIQMDRWRAILEAKVC